MKTLEIYYIASNYTANKFFVVNECTANITELQYIDEIKDLEYLKNQAVDAYFRKFHLMNSDDLELINKEMLILNCNLIETTQGEFIKLHKNFCL